MRLSGEFRFPAAIAVFWWLAGFGLDITAEVTGDAQVESHVKVAQQTPAHGAKAGLRPLPPVVPIHSSQPIISPYGSSR